MDAPDDVPLTNLGVVATLVMIRTRDSKAHLEMSNEQAAPAAA